MTSPDQPTTSTPAGLPEPPSGAGAADLATDSTDPQELRELLERARERLSFYESFDRIIGENIRRSGELMVETVSLREQARSLAEQSEKDHATFEATRQADRDRYRALIKTALDEAASVQPVIDTMVGKLRNVLEQLGEDSEPVTHANAATSAANDEPEPILTEPDAPEAATEDVEPVEASTDVPDEPQATEVQAESAGPRTIQVLAHRVPNAKTAIALQKMLRGLDAVSNVDAREFANGELRLAVSATGSLPEDSLSAWLADNAGELTSTAESVTEITFSEA